MASRLRFGLSDYYVADEPDQLLRRWNPFCEGPAVIRPGFGVMTFNIHHGVGVDGVLGLDRIASTIRSADVEVAGLQEVDRHWSERSQFVDQATWLAEELGMYVAFGANLDRDPPSTGPRRRQFGTAILSRHPILESRNHLLPRFEGSEQRGLLEASIEVDGQRVRAYNTHLQHDSAAERVAQIEAVSELIGTPTESVVVVGDLNAAPSAPEIAHLLDELTDSWAEAGVGDGHTFSASSPRIRSDYILTSPNVITRTVAVVTASRASDHLPVVARLLLPGPVV